MEINDQSLKSLGILVHPTSLPGGTYCGTFGKCLEEWIDALSRNSIKTWQFLPLSPTDSTGSPYSSPSSFAINPWLIDVEELMSNNYIFQSEAIHEITKGCELLNCFDFDIADKIVKIIGELLLDGWNYQSDNIKDEFMKWLVKNPWVEDYALFVGLKENFSNLAWWEWPEEFSSKKDNCINLWISSNKKRLLITKLIQWHLDRQWQKIRFRAKSNGIKLIGDLPFYVSKDSVDVWSNKSLFSISNNGDLIFQSGVPPDYFSDCGQLWGTPVYSWAIHERTKFNWWIKRFTRQFELVDYLRLDHFRAMAGYWRIDGKAKNAIDGEWIRSPGNNLLKTLMKSLGVKSLPIIAEDLGVITDDVNVLRNNFNLAGMKILQFAFDGNKDNPYLPENYVGSNWVVYTGTHDNSTTVSWWNNLDEDSKENLKENFNFSDKPSWNLMELGISTDAKLFIAPIQDILSLDDSCRLNKPGTVKDNWKWKLNISLEEISPFLEKYSELGKRYSRN